MTKLIFVLICLAGYQTAVAADRDRSQDLIVTGEKVTKAGSGFIFTEGPAVAPDGRVFFTDQPNDKIEVWSEDGKITTFMQSCERSNGTYFNKKGELISCADLYNRVIAITMDKKIRTLAENFNGNHLNGPNDLWIAPDGSIYFSDPYYQRDYWEPGHSELQDTRGVYFMNRDGKVQRVIGDFQQPNGLIGTPDGKILYVSDIKDHKIWKYNINKDGTLSNKTFFAPEGSDGMTIDRKGNIYLTNQCVSVFDAKGNNIARIQIPEQPSNICFGGKNRDILFITARTSVYTLKMKVRGY
jgi:gluconolactonase